MRKRAIFLAAILVTAIVLPLIIFNAHATLSAGPNQQAYDGKTVTFNGTTTDDPTLITRVIWDFGDNTPVLNETNPSFLNTTHVYAAKGIYTANLTVSFGPALNNKNESATAQITIVQNVPPIAKAGPDQTIEQTSITGATATLDGSASSDQYNDPLTYSWTWTGGSASGVTATASLPPGTTTVTLTVSDGEFAATDTVDITVRDSTPPFVTAGPDITAEAGSTLTLNGTATDVVSTLFSFTWTENGNVLKTETSAATTSLPFATQTVGAHDLTLSATDDAGNTGTANVKVTIVDTTPPSVNAGQDVTIEAGSPLTLNGTASDFVSTLFDFTWSEGGNVLKTETNSASTSLPYETKFKVGTHEMTLSATDDAGNTGTATVTVTVVDTTPPILTAAVAPGKLWPPNHKYVEVKITASAEDLGDPSPAIAFVSMSSSEAENAKGDGNTVNDIVKVDDFTFNMRAERSGRGSGRTYAITYRATDAYGNSATATVTVQVPHA